MRKSATTTVKGRKSKGATSPKKATASNGPLTDWIVKYATDPDEVRAFCARHRLFKAAHETLKLAQEVYGPRALRAQIEGDPEGSSEWLIFEVDIHATVDEALEADDRFTRRWIDMLPVSKLLLIRVLSQFV